VSSLKIDNSGYKVYSLMEIFLGDIEVNDTKIPIFLSFNNFWRYQRTPDIENQDIRSLK
jgi:hypothetical protein